MPSGAPGSSPCVVAQTAPPVSSPEAARLKTRMCPRAVSLTKRRDSSSEKHSPLGWAKSSASSAGGDPVEAAKGQFRLPGHAEEGLAAIGRIGEIDGAARRNDDVVRAVERLV